MAADAPAVFDVATTKLSIPIISGQRWMETDRYDVTGQPEAPGIPNLVQVRAMVRQWLTDRFKLAFYRGKRELPVYAIVVGDRGPKLGVRVPPLPADATAPGLLSEH